MWPLDKPKIALQPTGLHSHVGRYFSLLKMKIGALFAGMLAVDLLVLAFSPQGVTVEAFDPIDQTVIARCIGVEVLTRFVFMKLPTECECALCIGQGFQVHTDLGRFGKGNTVSFQKKGQILWNDTPMPRLSDPVSFNFASFQPSLNCFP